MKKLLKNLFLKNWGLKLFSFILALVLWLTFIPEEKIFSEKTLTIPLVLHNTPPQMEVVEKPPQTVDVTIRAPRRLLGQILPTNVQAELDLSSASVDQQDFPLSPMMIFLPFGAEVKEIFPSQVRLRLENIREVLLDVEPSFTGQLPEGLVMTNYEIIPPQVLIKGPESKFKEGYKLRTSPIDRSLLTESAELVVSLILPSTDLRLATPQTTVTVRMLIQSEEALAEGGAEADTKTKPKPKRKKAAAESRDP
jgi:YbbR domain-containing protein